MRIERKTCIYKYSEFSVTNNASFWVLISLLGTEKLSIVLATFLTYTSCLNLSHSTLYWYRSLCYIDFLTLFVYICCSACLYSSRSEN